MVRRPVQRREVGHRDVAGAPPQLGGDRPQDDRGEDPAVPELVSVDVEGEPDAEDERSRPPTSHRTLATVDVRGAAGAPSTRALETTTVAPSMNAASTWKNSSVSYTAARTLTGDPDASRMARVAEVSNYEIVNHCFDVAADRLGLRDDVRAVLRSAYREVQVQIPVELTDGRIHVFSGYRVQHNGARGPVQGRHALPPGGRPRRGARAGVADDLEDGGRRRPVRRRQGRRQLRPADAARAATSSSAITRSFIDKIEKVLGPDARHPRARRQHQRPGDGLDDGRVRQAPRPHAGDRHRQADRARAARYGREAATGRGVVYLLPRGRSRRSA